MAGKLSPEREREWIAIAARVVARLLKDELGIDSERGAERCLGINYRTMAKLKPDSPGTGLQWETLDKILYRIEAIMRDEKMHDEQEICSMMSNARYEISRAYYGEYKPKGKS